MGQHRCHLLKMVRSAYIAGVIAVEAEQD